jgi:hypothetical protein
MVIIFSAPEIEYSNIETDGEYIQLNQTEIMEGEIQEDEDRWEDKGITLLLNLYFQNKDRFRNSKIKKKNVWMDIANAMGRTPECCDKKFRNLKMTYIRLLKTKKNKSSVKWPYFEIFEEIFSDNGEYQPEIQQKIQECDTENVAKVLLSMNTSHDNKDSINNSEEISNSQGHEAKKKLDKKRFNDFRKISIEMRDRQRVVEEKLDRLINIVEESNSIQRERNALFEQFLEKLNRSQ